MDKKLFNTYEFAEQFENGVSRHQLISFLEENEIDETLLSDIFADIGKTDTLLEFFGITPKGTIAIKGSADYKNTQAGINDEMKKMHSMYFPKKTPKPVEYPSQTQHAASSAQHATPSHEDAIAKAKANYEATLNDHNLGNGSYAEVEEAKKKLDALTKQHTASTATTQHATTVAKPAETAAQHTNTAQEVHSGTTPEHHEGIIDKVKGAYNTIKQSASEHLGHLTKWASENPGSATAAGVAGAAGAALAGYAAYKHFKNKRQMKNLHNEAHAAAMKNINATHPHMSNALSSKVSDHIKQVINNNKGNFKKDFNKSKDELVKHFGSNEYKSSLIH